MAQQHRGEIVAAAVRRSGVKLSQLFPVLGISRPTLYRRFEDPHLSFEFIRQVGEVIHYDFGREFRELSLTAALEPIVPYQLESLEDCKDKLLHVYSLYADMVQRYNALLAESNK
jgi:hypothetical protein